MIPDFKKRVRVESFTQVDRVDLLSRTLAGLRKGDEQKESSQSLLSQRNREYIEERMKFFLLSNQTLLPDDS